MKSALDIMRLTGKYTKITLEITYQEVKIIEKSLRIYVMEKTDYVGGVSIFLEDVCKVVVMHFVGKWDLS